MRNTEPEDSVTVVLDLSERCVETAAQREFKRRMARLLEDAEGGDADQDEEALELLRAFLEERDFSRLRAAYEELAGGTPIKVRLYRGREGAPELEKWTPTGAGTGETFQESDV